MSKMTGEAFIAKYGTDGLRHAIGCKTEGCIIRGNDYALVQELLVHLNLLENPKSEYRQWWDEYYAKTPMERLHSPEFSQVIYCRQQAKIDTLIESEAGMAVACLQYRQVIRDQDQLLIDIKKVLASEDMFYESKCEFIQELLKDKE